MRHLLLLLILTSTLCFAQKHYEFDYLIEYELITYKDSTDSKGNALEDKRIKRFYLTNSQKNNYLAVITDLDSLNYQMDFKDEDGLSFNVNFLKTDLNKAEYIKVNCQYVRKYQNPYKAIIKDYDFFVLNDTLINGYAHPRYKLSSIKPKKKKRKQLATEFYIIDKQTAFHLPIFYFPTAYQEWKSKQNVPNGIFLERYLIKHNGNLGSKEKLHNYWKIDKKMVIEDACDFTKKI